MKPTALLLLVACAGQTADSGPGPQPEAPLEYVPVAPWERTQFEGVPVRTYIPDNPRGVVVFFHGTNGNVSIVNQLEPVAFLNTLIDVGIGFVTTDSGEQPSGKWIDGDVERVGRLYQHVVDTTALEPTDALFLSGFSGGGNMAGSVAAYAQAQGWPVRAINPNQSSCSDCGDLGLPTYWVLNENDTGPHEWAQNAHDRLVDGGVAARIYHVDEQVLTGDSFTKHPDMTPERSQRVVDDMEAKLMVDADGVRLVPDEEADQWCTWYGKNGEGFGPEARGDELRVLWALHRFSAEPAREVRDFFLDAL